MADSLTPFFGQLCVTNLFAPKNPEKRKQGVI